jgi:hypothetical protein
MSFGIYGILILFGAFVLLLVLNPNITCFGRRLKSPFYPLFRKREMSRKARGRGTGLELGKGRPDQLKEKHPPHDYGFRLD